MPPSLRAELGGVRVHRGDLHVHSCHGEALNACAPSTDCLAESLQLFGSFSFAALRSQYEVLGVDWFSATDHSYCINSASEYDAIAGELAAITDGTFLALPDTEVSSDEAGPQRGSDLGDLLCLGFNEANHMGAHGIEERIPGGDDGFLGFCDGLFNDALASFVDNVAEIRSQGGLPIVHHPSSESWGWNSFEALEGIEAGGIHGVEIWNGASRSGQGGHVASWVDWLLAGRILYGYSGSDTHDAAFDFGANHVLLAAPLDATSLLAAVGRGRTFVSNGPFLALSAELAGRRLWMGDVRPQPVDPPPGEVLEIRAHYSMGSDVGRVTIYRGTIGDPGEDVLCESAPLGGTGVFSCTDPSPPPASRYYRAYAENDTATRTAYTNPIFLIAR